MCIVIGIGGSNLGTLAVGQALFGPLYNQTTDGIKLYFADTVDADQINDILVLAQKELEKHTDIEFSFEEHKTGRRFTHIDFYVKWDQNKDDYKGIEDAAMDVKSKKCLEYLDKIGIKNQKYRDTIVNEKQDEFWKWVYQVKTQKIKPKSHSGHLLSVLNIK